MVIKFFSQTIGFIYCILALFVIIVLWKKGLMSRKIRSVFLFASVLSGFLFFSPVAPYQFQTVFLRNLSSHGSPAVFVVFGLLFIAIVSFVIGRIFCGNICPVGALQEIISAVPVKKRGKYLKKYYVFIRFFVFIAFLVLAVLFSISLIGILGIKDFFTLNMLSISFYVFLIFVILSFFIYRPFCRFICPYGLFLSLLAIKSRYKFRRTDLCIDCRKCETVCPVDEAKAGDNKSECYMCGRCVDVCPVKGALVYSSEFKKE